MNTYQNTAIATDVSTVKVPMSSLRKTSLVAGGLYLLTIVSITALALYGSGHGMISITDHILQVTEIE